MNMLKVQAIWTGFAGAPGYSNFYFAGGGGLISDAQQVADRVAEAFDEIDVMLPVSARVNVSPTVEVIDSDTGELQGYQDVDEPDGTRGLGGSGGYSAASGAVINWRTSDVRFGRRIRGRTFIVPLNGNAYEGDGSLTPDALSSLRSFADTLTVWDFDSEFGIWSRPRNGAGGVFATVDSYRVPDMSAVLRSRRD